MPEVHAYKKQNSFAEITRTGTLDEILPRLEALRQSLDTLAAGAYQREILEQALTELLDRDLPPDIDQPFQLYPYNIEEIKRLPEKDLGRYLFYRYRYEVFPQRRKLDSFPPCLQVEPTSICNYRCVFCYQVDPEFTRKKNGMMGMMPLDLFRRIVDQAEGHCEAITLASRGEPLICPDFVKMLDYASGKFLALKVNTNAWFLDEAMAHALLQSGVNTLVFSADAASEPQYSQLRVNGNLERVHRNIARFQEIRARHYPDSRIITRISGVKVPGTDGLETMERFWGDLVDQVAFVNYNPWENTYEQPPNGIQEPCSDLWRRMFIWWDGKINPCDSDFKSTLAVGNAYEDRIEDLWLSEPYQSLRARHEKNLRTQCHPCNRCAVI